MGRELTDERVTELIKDESKIKLYISKGLSEIHWREKKISHFSFLEKMRNSAYCEIIEKIISGVLDNFDKNEIEKIVLNIDEKLPESYRRYKIPEERKKLITKLITLRIEKLKELI